MADIFQDLPIKGAPDRVFDAVSTPGGLDCWWTKTSSGIPEEGSVYELRFGPGYDWRAKVIRCNPRREFELEIVRADEDWEGTHVGFRLEPGSKSTLVRFRHTGWPVLNEHYRTSSHCWAMYLRLLRRYVEYGEVVAYDDRLEA